MLLGEEESLSQSEILPTLSHLSIGNKNKEAEKLCSILSLLGLKAVSQRAFLIDELR